MKDNTAFEVWYDRNEFKRGDHVELLISSTLMRGVIESVSDNAVYLLVEQRKNISDPADAWEPVAYKKKLSLFEMRCYCHEVRR